jgi:hypothetical protein
MIVSPSRAAGLREARPGRQAGGGTSGGVSPTPPPRPAPLRRQIRSGVFCRHIGELLHEGREFGRGLLGAFTLSNKLRFRDCEALRDSEKLGDGALALGLSGSHPRFGIGKLRFRDFEPLR